MSDPFLHDPFARVRPSAANDSDHADAAARRAAELADRVLRMEWIVRFTDQVLAGEPPNADDLLFIASALDAWLSDPCNVQLERVLGVATPRGSKLTPAELAARIRRA